MSGQDRDYVQEIEDQMRAAEALIESLEEEVSSLRQDLEQASVALKAAQEEVAVREEALEEQRAAHSAAERKQREAGSAITELRIQSSNDQLELTNQHISELARLQDRFQDQLRTEIEAGLSADDRETLVEEHRKVRQAAERLYEERIAALEGSYREAQERLREGEREFEERRAAEISALHQESEEQKRALERKMQEKFEGRLQEALDSAAEDHESELDALRRSFADREQELQNEHRAALENQRAEFEAKQKELEDRAAEAEERHQTKLREIKSVAESREQELKKAHSARLAETKSEVERRVEALRAQRKADNRALRVRHEEDLSNLRARYEERMKETAEQSRWELWTVQEKLEGINLERTAEAATYNGRLRELEAAIQSQVAGTQEAGTEEAAAQVVDEEDTLIMTREISATESPSQQQEISTETSRLQQRVEDLEAALSVSEGARNALTRELEELQQEETTPDRRPRNVEETADMSLPQVDEPQAGEDPVSGRIRELETRLQEAREESRRNAEELQRAAEELRRLSDPERRLRSGISAFNASEHARHVASISMSLGLPKVRADIDEESTKPVFTFLWEELAWRRYVAEPAEDLQEPRVYLLSGGDDPEEFDAPEEWEPNARVDAQGRLILGVQAR